MSGTDLLINTQHMGEGIPKKTEQEVEVDMSYVEMATGEKAPKKQIPESAENERENVEFPSELGVEYVSKISGIVEAINKTKQEHPELQSEANSHIFAKHLESVNKSFGHENGGPYSFFELFSTQNNITTEDLEGDVTDYRKGLAEWGEGKGPLADKVGSEVLKLVKADIGGRIAYFEAVKAALDATVSEIEVRRRLVGKPEADASEADEETEQAVTN